MILNSDAKFEQTLALQFQKQHEELGELSEKSEKQCIDGLFLFKTYNVSIRKFKTKVCDMAIKVMQNLKEN